MCCRNQFCNQNEGNEASESNSENNNNNNYESENEEECDQWNNEDLYQSDEEEYNDSNIDDREKEDEEEHEERHDNEDRNNDNIDQNQPLYNGAEISVGASMLIILTLLLNHNLTMSCIEDIIIALELHCLHEGLKRNSLYKFRKYFRLSETNIIKHCSRIEH